MMKMESTEALWQELNGVSSDLLDIYREFEEVPSSAPLLSLNSQFELCEENLDEFDWSGMQYSFTLDSTTEAAPEKVDWDEMFASIETMVANGCLTEPNASDFSSNHQYGSNVLRTSGAYFKGETSDIGFLFRQLNRLGTNNVDIMSMDDSVFEKNHNVVSNFEMKVPLEIYGQDEELIIKADIPDILFSSANAEDMKVPFKSVLALLPERINTRQLQPTFVDGQFRLELPKREEKKDRKIN